MQVISSKEAKDIALAGQGLAGVKGYGTGKNGVENAFINLGYVQIDAISVVKRAHHHTLYNRVLNYKENHLLRLLSKEKKIFEYWGHAVAFFPMSSYRYHQLLPQHIASKGYHWHQIDRKFKQFVIDRIRDEGPLYARDFKTDGKFNRHMWDHKPAKKALHELFMEGKIMVASRDAFQRKYDLTERHLPAWVNVSVPSEKEIAEYHIQTKLKSLGVLRMTELTYLTPWLAKAVKKHISGMIEQGVVQEVGLNSNANKGYFVLTNSLQEVGQRISRKMRILSPFDNLVIQRKFLKRQFDFEYQTEIYFPPHKRVHGYFSSPLLWGRDFIGWIDPKADRKNKRLIINNLSLIPEVKISDRLIADLNQAIREFARFNDCDEYHVTNSNPEILRQLISS